MRHIVPFAVCLALAAASVASPAAPPANSKGEARLAKILTGWTAGTPVNCVSLGNVRDTEIIDGTAIVYRTSGKRLYVNRPSGSGSLRSDDILVTRISGSQLCSIDSIRLLDRLSRFPRSFVTLGKFVPYTRNVASRTP
jgi:hypothetical protein